MKNLQHIISILLLLCFVSGCSPTDQVTYPGKHDSILMDYNEAIDIPALFRYGVGWEAVPKVETKYSSLYKQDNKREMYIFSVPIKELANEKFSFFDTYIQQLNEFTCKTNNENFNILFNATDITLEYYNENLTLKIEEAYSVNQTEDCAGVQYKTEEYDLEVFQANNAALFQLEINQPIKEILIPIEADKYKAKNDKAGYAILKEDDADKIIISQAIIYDKNEFAYPNTKVRIKNKAGQKYIVYDLPSDIEYPVRLEFEVDFYTENMFFDSSAYEENPRVNSLYNNVSIFNTLEEGREGYTYMKFNIKSFTPKKKELLESVYLNLYVKNCIEGTTLEIYSMQEDWCAWTLSWKTKPQHKEKLGEVELTKAGWYTIDLSEYTKRLIDNDYYGRVDNSILIKAKDETGSYAIIASTDNKVTPPFFKVNYLTEH